MCKKEENLECRFYGFNLDVIKPVPICVSSGTENFEGFGPKGEIPEGFKCDRSCPCFKNKYIEYPITVNNIDKKLGNDKPLGHEVGEFVAVRPCDEEYEGKTFFGILIGDLPFDVHVAFQEKDGTLKIGMFRNPAIYVPELKKIVYGMESWWHTLESEDDLKAITTEDIENTWYVKLFKSLKSAPTAKTKIIRLKYIETENGEDIFRCQDNKRFYVRQKLPDGKIIWLSASKWKGGYEATAPLEAGTIITVVNRDNTVLFREQMVSCGSSAFAEKVGYSFNEKVSEFADEVVSQSTLHSHRKWVEWLLAEKNDFGYTDFNDNWLYCEAEISDKSVLEERKIFDKEVYLVKKSFTHKICGKSWVVYEIVDSDDVCLNLVGYAF